MDGIELLVKEHENILDFTRYLRKICCDILEGKEVDIAKLRECVSFGRNYADKQHHGKEEKVLFRIMMEKLGPTAQTLIRNGMLVEHDLGRYHMGELVGALDRYEKEPSTQIKLDIISNASAYANLLQRHIAKEDEVCYSFALRRLTEEDKREVDEETREFEDMAMKNRVQEKYTSWLTEQIKSNNL